MANLNVDDESETRFYQRVMNAVHDNKSLGNRRSHHYSNRRSHYHRHGNRFNIMDYVEWMRSKGYPIDYRKTGRGVFNIKDRRPGGNEGHDLSSVYIGLRPDSYNHNATFSTFSRHSSQGGQWKGKLPPLNRFAIMMHDHYDSGNLDVNSKEGSEWATKNLKQFVKEYGATHAHTAHSWQDTGASMSTYSTNVQPKSSPGQTSNNIDYFDKEKTYGPAYLKYKLHKNPRYINYIRGIRGAAYRQLKKKHVKIPSKRLYQLLQNDIKPDNKLAYNYLTRTRGINPGMVNSYLRSDLVRGYDAGIQVYKSKGQIHASYMPPRVEFIRRMPKDTRVYSQFSNSQGKQIPRSYNPRLYTEAGKDTIYVKRDRQGKWQNDHHLTDPITGQFKNCKHIDYNNEKDYGWNFKTGNGQNRLYVFEAPIDAISYYNLHIHDKKSLNNSTFMSLGGASKVDTIPAFMNKQLKGHNSYKQIIITPDNDDAGHSLVLKATASQKNKADYSNKGRDLLANGKANQPSHIITSEIPYDEHGSINTDPSRGFDWNDALKNNTIKGLPIKHNGGMKLSANQYAQAVVSQKMSRMSPDGQRKFDVMMGGYGHLYDNVHNHHEPVDRSNPRIALMRNAYTKLNKHDKGIVDDFMNNGGGSYISGHDLQRYTHHYTTKFAGGSLQDNLQVQQIENKHYGAPQYKIDTAKAISSMATGKDRRLFLDNITAKANHQPTPRGKFDSKSDMVKMKKYNKNVYSKYAGKPKHLAKLTGFATRYTSHPIQTKAELLPNKEQQDAYRKSHTPAKIRARRIRHMKYVHKRRFYKGLNQVRNSAANNFHIILEQTLPGSYAKKYLNQHGYSDDFIKKHHLGYAPKFDPITYNKNKQLPKRVLKASKLFNGRQDKFNDQFVEPKYNKYKEIVGFTASKPVHEPMVKFIQSKRSRTFIDAMKSAGATRDLDRLKAMARRQSVQKRDAKTDNQSAKPTEKTNPAVSTKTTVKAQSSKPSHESLADKVSKMSMTEGIRYMNKRFNQNMHKTYHKKAVHHQRMNTQAQKELNQRNKQMNHRPSPSQTIE